ncbi:MAG: glycerol-3-phosphate dehydrogenase C-terminal domain-containing protein, partial [Pseudomonadota bacterium]
FRLIALDVLQAAKKYVKKLNGGEFGAQIFTRSAVTSDAFAQLPSYVQKRLTGHYGMDVDALLAMAREDELEVIPGARAIWAELRWAAANEAVVHLDDLLLRRTRLGLLLPQGGMQFEDKIRAVCAEELGWSEQQWAEEKARYQSIWEKHYGVPA